MPWQVIAMSADDLRRWGNEFVAYDPSSGDTHLLNLSTGWVLQELLQYGCLDSTALQNRLNAASGGCAVSDSDVQQSLEGLQSATLIAWI